MSLRSAKPLWKRLQQLSSAEAKSKRSRKSNKSSSKSNHSRRFSPKKTASSIGKQFALVNFQKTRNNHSQQPMLIKGAGGYSISLEKLKGKNSSESAAQNNSASMNLKKTETINNEQKAGVYQKLSLNSCDSSASYQKIRYIRNGPPQQNFRQCIKQIKRTQTDFVALRSDFQRSFNERSQLLGETKSKLFEMFLSLKDHYQDEYLLEKIDEYLREMNIPINDEKKLFRITTEWDVNNTVFFKNVNKSEKDERERRKAIKQITRDNSTYRHTFNHISKNIESLKKRVMEIREIRTSKDDEYFN